MHLYGLENAIDRGDDIDAALGRLVDLYEKAGDPEKIEMIEEEYGL